MIRVLFICTGNICRSPTAEGVFQRLVNDQGLGGEIEIDSAGTHGFHVGAPPDRRAQEAAARRGVDISGSRARQVTLADFTHFDYVVAMDEHNLTALRALAPAGAHATVYSLLAFSPTRGEREVPDPYFGGRDGFEHVLDMIEAAAAGLLAHLRHRHPFSACPVG